MTVSGCAGGSSRTPSAAELKLERQELVTVANGLQTAADGVHNEVSVAHAAWPELADGLPARPSPALRAVVERASGLAAKLPQPSFMRISSRLTGPAAGLAGLYETFARLCERAWRLTETTIATILSGPASAARFVRGNAWLYLSAIYDSHYDLSLIGKSVQRAYERLGGQAAFGAKLSPVRVQALADSYSIARVRLTPHPATEAAAAPTQAGQPQ